MMDDIKKLKITNKRLKMRILATVSRLRTQLAKLYAEEKAETKKVVAITVASILVEGYDTEKEMREVFNEIKNRMKNHLKTKKK